MISDNGRGIVLNLAAGDKRYPDPRIINVDIVEGEGIQQIVDLNVFPWPWEDNSIEGIHASHILEHFLDHEKFIRECHRILKPGAFFRVVVPHCTSVSSIGCLGHYRTFSADTLHRYLAGGARHDCYMFKDIKFVTVEQRVNWLWEEADKNGIKHFPDHMRHILHPFHVVISFIINLCPQLFERFWHPLVGGASEVVWKGVKI